MELTYLDANIHNIAEDMNVCKSK